MCESSCDMTAGPESRMFPGIPEREDMLTAIRVLGWLQNETYHAMAMAGGVVWEADGNQHDRTADKCSAAWRDNIKRVRILLADTCWIGHGHFSYGRKDANSDD